MTEFSGKTLKLAGFDIHQKGTLVDVFARFCGLDQDPANLPQTRVMKLFADSAPAEVPCIYPVISAEQIAEALVGPRDIAQGASGHFRLPGGPEDVLADLGAEKLALLLPEMAKAKRDYLENGIRTFVPATPVKAPSGPV